MGPDLELFYKVFLHCQSLTDSEFRNALESEPVFGPGEALDEWCKTASAPNSFRVPFDQAPMQRAINRVFGAAVPQAAIHWGNHYILIRKSVVEGTLSPRASIKKTVGAFERERDIRTRAIRSLRDTNSRLNTPNDLSRLRRVMNEPLRSKSCEEQSDEHLKRYEENVSPWTTMNGSPPEDPFLSKKIDHVIEQLEEDKKRYNALIRFDDDIIVAFSSSGTASHCFLFLLGRIIRLMGLDPARGEVARFSAMLCALPECARREKTRFMVAFRRHEKNLMGLLPKNTTTVRDLIASPIPERFLRAASPVW